MEPVRVTAPNGDQFLLRPMTPAVVRQVLVEQEKKGIRLTSGENSAADLARIDKATAQAIIVGWYPKSISGGVMETSEPPSAISDLIDSRPKIVQWCLRQARQALEAMDTEFEERDEKN